MKFHRRRGTAGLHGEMYEVKTAAFLFARALHKTEEFYLASNVDGAGAFDDLVFRYRLRGSNIWKTCFIQLKHKRNEVTINCPCLTQMSGDFSLLKYFESYCQIKSKASTDRNLKQCGLFDDFEFVIYTNAKMKVGYTPKGGDSDEVSILSSGTNYGKYISFDENRDTDIFGFFEELSRYHDLVRELESLLEREALVDEDMNERIEKVQSSVTNRDILDKLKNLKSTLSKEGVTKLIKEIGKCDCSLYKEFLKKVKIFQSQSNEKSFKQLIEKELQDACNASLSVANSIYTNFEKGISKWWEKDGNVEWLKKGSHLWLEVETHFITEIKEIPKPELQENVACGIRFKQQHIQRLCDVLEKNTVLNIVTNSNIHTVQKLRTYQALDILGYTNSLFIGLKSLMFRRKEICKLWPCKWSAVLVIDRDSDGNVADILLDILQKSVGCRQGSNNSGDNKVETLIEVLQKYQQKVILISTRQHKNLVPSPRKKLRSYTDYVDNCDISDLEEEWQKKILAKTVNFQGKNVALQNLIGADPPEHIKRLVDSDIISTLLSGEGKLCVGRQLSDTPKYYVQRSLEHRVYLKDDVVKLTDNDVTLAVSGLQADQLKNYLPAGEKICEFVYDERKINHSFKIYSDFSNPGFSTERENMKSHMTGEATKPEDVRYVILGDLNPESDFRKLKELCTNVHWIHMEEGSFLWRDSNCDIDIICRNIDDTKCKDYDIEGVIEHKDKVMSLVAEPGMGKSTFLSCMEHKIKKLNPLVWVLRINLNEQTLALKNIEFEQDCIDKCKMFLWNAAHSPEQDALQLVQKIFKQALEHTGKMVIILDGFDEISQDYSPKVERLIREIRAKTSSKIWVSSRSSCRHKLEDILKRLPFTLQPFKPENQIQFMKQYWNEVIKICKKRRPRKFARKLLSLCSHNFSDKDGEFTGNPLQIKMLGEAFMKEAEKYCSTGKFNLPQKFNLLDLFRKFTENKFNIYLIEKNAIDNSKPGVKIVEQAYFEIHMISALISLFSLNEVKELMGDRKHDLKQAKEDLHRGTAQQFGIIRDIIGGKPQFIHRCFAEYFAAKWFTDNFRKCEDFISDKLFNSTYEVTRNIFDRMLAEEYEMHGAVLNNDISAVQEFLKNGTDINISDKGGRTALHLAASCNSSIIQEILLFPGADANKPDAVLKWTPLRYADRTKSWLAMDVLLQKGANADDIVLTRSNIKAPEWGERALWECASKGHVNLLVFMLNNGVDVNAVVEVPENTNAKCILLHRASFYGQFGVVRLLVEHLADVNIRNANNDTALHFAAKSGSVNIINLLVDKGMSANLTNTHDDTPLHVSARCGNLEATKTLIERGAAVNSTNLYGNTPLMSAAYDGKSEVFYYLTEVGADINIRNIQDDSGLHYAALSGSVEIVKFLLDKGMSVNLTNTHDSTPLHVSAQCGNLEATKTLIERGAAVNSTNVYGNTPLMEAAYEGKAEVFRYLTEVGADINTRNKKEYGTIHYAAVSGSVEIIKFLLDEGISVNLSNRDNENPLDISARCGNLKSTKILVARGAAVNSTNLYGNTPLMSAAYEGKTEIFYYLTEVGADINIRSNQDDCGLHYAARSGSVEIVKFLLDKGMSVNLTNTHAATPLHVSAAYGNLEATKTLIERGAAVNSTNVNGNTPLMEAAFSGKTEVFLYLTEFGADNNIRNKQDDSAIHYAAVSGSVEIIKFLLDTGMSVNLTNRDDSTPLHVSAQYGNLEATKTLVERGAAVNSTNVYGNTPLISAAYKGKTEVFYYLTEVGADINIRNKRANSALHFAARSGSVEIIRFLLDKGMSVNLTNTHAATPLHVSAAYGNLEATKTLVASGAALNSTNVYGSTPLMSAACEGKTEVRRYLAKFDADTNIRNNSDVSAIHFAARLDSVDIMKF